MNDGREILPFTKHLVGGARLPIAEDRNILGFVRRDWPSNTSERLADNRQSFWIVAQQMRPDSVHRRGVVPGQDQPQRERLRTKWAVPLAGHHCVHHVKDLPLWLTCHGSIRSAIQKNPVEVQTCPPDRIVSRPGTIGPYSVPRQPQCSNELPANPMPNFGHHE